MSASQTTIPSRRGQDALDPKEHPRTAIRLETPEYAARLAQRQASPHGDLYALLDQVRDPELPELSIWDLGVLREVRQDGGGLTVAITPTYSGCPALAAIREDIATCLTNAGCQGFEIVEQTRPPWTTALMSRAACAQLRAGGDCAAGRWPGALPGLRQRRDGLGQRVRFDRLQGALPLPDLLGALRPLQDA